MIENKPMKRILALMLAVVLALSTTPLTAMPVNAEGSESCTHAHDELCGYTEGAACSHEHDEACDGGNPDGDLSIGQSDEGDESDTGEHDDTGEPAVSANDTSDEIKTITAFDTAALLVPHYAHADAPKTQDELALPAELAVTVEGKSESVDVPVTWEPNAPYTGELGETVFTALPCEGYALARGLDAPTITVTVSRFGPQMSAPQMSAPQMSAPQMSGTQALGDYNLNDIIAINDMIQLNKLTGYYINDPDNWDFITWTGDAPNKQIQELNVSSKGLIGTLDVSGCTALTTLNCAENTLTQLIVTNCTLLQTLDCHNNPLQSLTLAGGEELAITIAPTNNGTVSVSSVNPFTKEIALTATPRYGYVLHNWTDGITSNDNPTSITLSSSTNVTANFILDTSDTYHAGDKAVVNNIIRNNNLTGYKEDDPENWDFITWEEGTSNRRIQRLVITRKNLTGALDVSGLDKLMSLDCSGNNLTQLNASGCTALTQLNCVGNFLTQLDVSGWTGLIELDCSVNDLTQLNVSGCTGLIELDCSFNELTQLDVSGLDKLVRLDCSFNELTQLDVSGFDKLVRLNCYNNELTQLDVSSCTGLIELNCSKNELTQLDVSGFDKLVRLECYNNKLPQLDVSGCTGLIELNCDNNELPQLNVSGLDKLEYLFCGRNKLEELDVSGFDKLVRLECDQNALTQLDVSGLDKLEHLSCDGNNLTQLNVSGLDKLKNLYCYGNNLTQLDVSGCTVLEYLSCADNAKMQTLNASGCTSLILFDMSGCTSLTQLIWDNSPLQTLKLTDGELTVAVSPADSGTVNVTSIDPTTKAITLTATPETGYTFKDWTGGENSSQNPLSFTLQTGQTTVTANFIEDQQSSDTDTQPQTTDESNSTTPSISPSVTVTGHNKNKRSNKTPDTSVETELPASAPPEETQQDNHTLDTVENAKDTMDTSENTNDTTDTGDNTDDNTQIGQTDRSPLWWLWIVIPASALAISIAIVIWWRRRSAQG